MSTVERRAPPHWLRRSSVAWFGTLVAALAVLLTLGFLAYEKEALDTAEVQRAELYARVLQDHAERTFNTVDIALASLADIVEGDAQPADAASLARTLTQALHGLPFLRSLSLMDPGGHVLASSGAGNIGVSVDLSRVKQPLGAATDALGTSIAGRDLVDAAVDRAPAAPGIHTFVPLVRVIGPEAGPRSYLVAVLNPDFFANDHELTLADSTRNAALLSTGGVMLSATGGLRKVPGESAAAHRFLTDFFPARESGSFIGNGIDGTKVVTAFRVLRKRPVMVVVERSYANLVETFQRTVFWAAGACALALLVIAALTVMALRSLRSHESVRRTLDATRESVADSERGLRTLVESVHEVIFRADADGRIAFVNGRWRQLSGRPVSEIVGRRLAELCSDDERAACDLLFTPRSGTGAGAGAGADTIIRIDTADGAILTLELSVSAVLGPAGETIGYAGLALDVSQREAAQRALESQLAFTAQLLDVSPTPLFVKDERGRFVTVNRAWLDLMGMTLAGTLGRDSAELFGDDAAKHNQHDASLLRSDERTSYENRLLIAGRPARDTVVTKVRFTRSDGTPAGIVGSIIDVTEFREAERRIREASDTAQRANSARSEFIANISHELRTPLQAIIGFSEIGRNLAGEQPDFLDMFVDIHAGGQRMLTLVNGLLDVALMDSALGSLPLQRTDLAAFIRGVANQHQPAARLRHQSIRLHGLDTALAVDLDPVRLREAIGHVLANAIRYAPPETDIDVSCRGTGSAGVEITVRDRGPGIPEAELEAVFDAFVQSSRTRDGSGGTGLGLTIARKIMSAHGGSLVAANAPGGGALLRFIFPTAVTPERPGAGLSLQDAGDLLFEPEAN